MFLSELAGVHFVLQQPSRAFEPAPPYNEMIAKGLVPTREGHMHDFMNALVWSVFPLSKRALHVRQAHCIARRNASGNRSQEEDTLAILDEGGLLHVNNNNIVFGHAIYECMATGKEVVPPRALVLGVVDSVDVGLARYIADGERLLTKEDLKRVPLAQLNW